MIERLRPANRSVKDLGVKQAPFVVLIGAAMPSVLAEISFVTNAQDARYLKSGAYRERIAEALAHRHPPLSDLAAARHGCRASERQVLRFYGSRVLRF